MLRVVLLASMLLARATMACADTPLPVVATFSILGDLVQTIGGDRIRVETLVGPDGDTHAYAAKPGDIRRLAAAKLVFANGLGLETWLDRLADGANAKGKLIVASRDVAVRAFADGAPDPHAWQSVGNATRYAAAIRDALSAADPAGKAVYAANYDAYAAQLAALDRDIRDTLAPLPERKRRVVTPHPSFAYFGAEYGVTFRSAQALGHDAETSAKAVAALIDTIRREQIAALFVEGATESRLLRQIAAETGVRIGGALYADALTGADGAAPTYLAMMRKNLATIATALRD